MIRNYTNSNELPFVPFFGYEIDTWYSVTIEINESNIFITATINNGNTSKVKIINENDNQLKIGRVGFSCSGTQAAFGEIKIMPIPICYSKLNL